MGDDYVCFFVHRMVERLELARELGIARLGHVAIDSTRRVDSAQSLRAQRWSWRKSRERDCFVVGVFHPTQQHWARRK